MLRPIADVTGGATQAFVDRRDPAGAGRGPLPLGAIGKWDTRLPTLAQARSRHGIAAVPSPVDTTKTWIYVFGGHNGTSELDSMEFLEVDGSATQVYPAQWTRFTMPVARADLGTWVHTHSNVPVYVPGSSDVWVAIGSGRDLGGGNAQNLIYQGRVTATGDIGFSSSGASQVSAVFNYCTFTTTELSYWSGGLATTNLGGDSSIQKMDLADGTNTPPALSVTSTGVGMVGPRGTMGCGAANAHLFMSGGESRGDATGVIYETVESVLF